MPQAIWPVILDRQLALWVGFVLGKRGSSCENEDPRSRQHPEGLHPSKKADNLREPRQGGDKRITFIGHVMHLMNFPGGAGGKEPVCQQEM